ncbi:thiolase C-terminal domain-containing protein [Aurantiacibacter odishensis]
MVEAARQLRGEAANQQPDVDLCLAHANGGTFSSQATAILGSLSTI